MYDFEEAVDGYSRDVAMAALFDSDGYDAEPTGYLVLFEDGTWESDGLPHDVRETLLRHSQAPSGSMRFFSAGNGGRFFASFEDGTYHFWGGDDSNRLPSELGQLKSARCGDGAAKIRSLQWGGSGQYFVRYSYDKDWPGDEEY